MMDTFEGFGLSEDLIKGLSELGIVNPTTIQQEAIPRLLEQNPDFIGLAQTGTGKTAAFGIPLIELANFKQKGICSLVIAPTRELVMQIGDAISSFAKYKGKIRIGIVYGGTSVDKQIREIRSLDPQILIATPGRLIDFIKRKVVKLDKISHVVLDEADEMLNMGFKEDIDRILSYTPKDKRTWLFSATMPEEIRQITKKYMDNPVEVAIERKKQVNQLIEHRFALVRRADKPAALKRFLDYYPDIYGIVFCRTKIDTQKIASNLVGEGYLVEALHGDLSQAQREMVMAKFRAGGIRVLIATDVAARGIDVNSLTHIIHYALPDDRSYYTHRSGRTARAGKKGISLAIITPEEQRKVFSLQSSLGIKFTKAIIPSMSEVLEHKMQNWATKLIETKINGIPEQTLEKYADLFKDFSKEELLQKLLTIELKNIQLNTTEKNLNSGEKQERKDRKRKPGRTDREETFSGKSGKNNRNDKKGTHRYFINVGKMDGMNNGELLRFICEQSRLEKTNVGGIRMLDKCSFFDVDEQSSKKISHAFKNAKLKGRPLRVNRDNG